MDALRVTVPADQFASTAFWRRLNASASERGHDEHALMLVGHTEPKTRYTLRCVRCAVAVVDLLVDRS